MVLCDTNIIIEFFKGNQEIITELKEIGQENLAISAITAGELLFGAINKKELSLISSGFSRLNVLPVTEMISEKFLDLMMQYSLSHRPTIPDLLIAATAMVHDCELFTLNIKDFKYIDGVNLFGVE